MKNTSGVQQGYIQKFVPNRICCCEGQKRNWFSHSIYGTALHIRCLGMSHGILQRKGKFDVNDKFTVMHSFSWTTWIVYTFDILAQYLQININQFNECKRDKMFISLLNPWKQAHCFCYLKHTHVMSSFNQLIIDNTGKRISHQREG